MIEPNGHKRVLVLAYYFPPLGLSGVQRITKFVKYLPENGWLPHVISSRPYSYFAFDSSLIREIPEEVIVTRTRSLDPTRWRIRRGTVGIPSANSHGRLRAISNRLFVPDNKILWIPFARRAAESALSKHKFDAIFSTAPPYSSHTLAVELGERFSLPVVTDFRDNWVGNPRVVYAGERQKERHERLEADVLRRSRRVVAINKYIARDLTLRSGLAGDRFSVIEQGYDPEDFLVRTRSSDSHVTFVYSGVFYDAQKPDAFLHGLAKARSSSEIVRNQTRAVFVGLVPDYFSEMVGSLNLIDVVKHTGYLSHDSALAELRRADVPWMTIGHQPGEEQISTGKLAEYVGTRNPILGLVPGGAASDLLNEYGDSVVVDPDDIDATAGAIVALTDRVLTTRHKENPGNSLVNQSVVQRLDRRNLTRSLAHILESVTRP